MRIDAITPGENPPEELNVIIEVPVGGEPIKYELDKASGTLFVIVRNSAEINPCMQLNRELSR